MGRKPLGDRPMTGAEKQQRQRDKAKVQRDIARDAVKFLMWMDPDCWPDNQRNELQDLQRRIRLVEWAKIPPHRR